MIINTEVIIEIVVETGVYSFFASTVIHFKYISIITHWNENIQYHLEVLPKRTYKPSGKRAIFYVRVPLRASNMRFSFCMKIFRPRKYLFAEIPPGMSSSNFNCLPRWGSKTNISDWKVLVILFFMLVITPMKKIMR